MWTRIPLFAIIMPGKIPKLYGGRLPMTTNPSTHQKAREALTQLLASGMAPTPQNFALFFGQDAGRGLLGETLHALEGTFLEHPELCAALAGLRDSARVFGTKPQLFQHNLDQIGARKTEWLAKLGQRRRALREELQNLEQQQEQQQRQLQQARKRQEQQSDSLRAFGDKLPVELREAWGDIERRQQELLQSAQEAELQQMKELAISLHIGVLFDVLEQNLPSGETIADIDPLTQILNRRGFFRKLRQTSATEGALIAVDLDHFRKLNERFGHPGGDRVLQFTASLLQQFCRDNDLLARFGGEEFMLFLPNCPQEAAYKRAETIRMTLATDRRQVSEIPDRVTGSIGVTLWKKDREDFEEAYTRVDQALYAAKNRGRNRVIASWELES